VPGSSAEAVAAQWVGGIANLPGISCALGVRGGCLGGVEREVGFAAWEVLAPGAPVLTGALRDARVA